LEVLSLIKLIFFFLLQEAECEKAAMDIKYNTDTKVEDNSRMYKLQKAAFDKEINTAVSNILEIGVRKACLT